MSDIALHDFDGDDGGSAISAGAPSPSASTASSPSSASIWNPANVVTCVRIALVPLFAAVNMGRAKTAVTMVALCFLFAAPLFPFVNDMYSYMSFTGHALYAVAVILTVVSGAQYVWNARGMFV